MSLTFTRLLQTLEKQSELGTSDIAELNTTIRAALKSDSVEQIAALLTQLAMHDVTINTGNVTGTGIAIGPYARALVIQGADAASLQAGLHRLRQQIAFLNGCFTT